MSTLRKLFVYMCAFLLLLYGGAEAAYYDEGNTGDSWETAYILNTSEDFVLFRDRLKANSDDTGKYYKLGGDIDLSSLSSWPQYVNFGGHLDGQGYTISMDFTADPYCYGLFENINSSSADAALKNINFAGRISFYYHGGIVNKLNSGIIDNCTFSGSMSMAEASSNALGGFAYSVGEGGIIRNCTVTGTISVNLSSWLSVSEELNQKAGGIAGYLEGGLIENCTIASGAVITGRYYAGGIVATLNSGTIRDCVVSSGASVNAPQQFNGTNFGDAYNGSAGGIVGNKYSGTAEITGCTSDATVTSAQWVGGIIGVAYLTHSGDEFVPVNTTYSGNTFTNASLEFGNQSTDYYMRSDGSEEAPYEIHTSADILLMRERISSGSDSNNNYALTSDIDISSINWDTPIMNEYQLFSGRFDGQGHCITMSGDSLFSWLNGGTIGSLDIKGHIRGTTVGGIVHTATAATIRNCHFTGTVEAYSDSEDVPAIAGGIVGVHGYFSKVINCTFSGDVKSEHVSSYAAFAGGITGFIYAPTEYENSELNIVSSSVYAGSSVTAEGLTDMDVSDPSVDVGLENYETGSTFAAISTDKPAAGGMVGYASSVYDFYGNNSDAQVSSSKWEGGMFGYAVLDESETPAKVKGVSTYRDNTFTGASREIGNRGAYVAIDETNFPDDVFRAYVASADVNIDKNQDGYLSEAEIAAVTRINVYNKGISSLTGVEYFTALTELYCVSNQLTELDVSNNTALTYLNCQSNQLTVLDVSNNTALIYLDCYSNQLTSLDVSNTALTYLHCQSNQLTVLDVSNNTALTELFCYSNQLTALDVSNNTALESLQCYENQLTTLDVSNNTALTYLHCYSNQLTALDVSKNIALMRLYCYENQLTALDVSKNTVLKWLYCYDNQLTALDVSNNTALERLYCYSQDVSVTSPDTTGDSSYPYSLKFSALSASLDISRVYSLDVTDYYGSSVSYTADTSAGKWLFTAKPKTMTYYYYTGHSGSYMGVTATLAGAGVPLLAADSTNFPDSAFRSYISTYLDTNADSALSEAELANVTSLNLQGLGISDLTGIEHFTNLQILDCTANALTALDLSANSALVSLDCSNNQLVSLDISQCQNLLELYCDYNQLTALDVSQNSLLQILSCAFNYLAELDVSANTDLQLFSCTSNDIASIDLTANTQLQLLSIGSNDLQAIDLTANTQLQVLEVYGNRLTSLDVSGLTSMYMLNCMDNSLARLDLTSNTGLELVYLSGQTVSVRSADETGTSDFPYSIALTDIDSAFSQSDFSRVDSIDAVTYAGASMDTYIDEDDSDGIVYFSRRPGTMTYYYNTGAGSMDVKASFSTTGIIPITEAYFPDSAFRSYISSNFDIDGDNILNDAEIAEVNSIIVQNMGISSLKGIEYFTALTYLNCDSNQLTELNISKNSALTGLYCHSNQLTALDVAQNPYLTNLDCLSNQLTALDVTQNSYLAYLNCGDNLLTELDVTQNPALMVLYCWNNQLTELDVSHNPNLTMLECNTNQLTELNVSSNTALKALYCSKNKIETLDLSRNTQLVSLVCFDNALGALDLTTNVSLDKITVLEVTTPGSTIVYDLSSSDFSAQIVSCDSPDITGTAPYSYSLSFSAINASFDASRVYSLDVTDYDGVSVACSADTSTGKLLFTAKPKTMTYSYYTGYSNKYMGVTATLAGTAEEAFALTVSPASATITPGSSAAFTLTPANALGPVVYASSHSWVTFSGDIAIAAPTTEGTYTLTITAADTGRGSSNEASVSVAVTVSVPSSWTAITESAFPDSAFRSYLTDKYDSEGIGYLTDSDITVTSMDISGLGIADLTGIELFTALTSLDCSSNDLTGTLDLSANTALVYLNCSHNNLTALDVSECLLLEELICTDNQLTTLDVSNNSALKVLYCTDNQLTALDVSSNSLLEELECMNNHLTALDVNSNSALTLLDCMENHIAALDLSNKTYFDLVHFDSQTITLTSLDTTGQAALPYSISLNAAKSALGLSIDLADFAANVSEIDIQDSDGNTLTRSTDIIAGTVYFSGKPETIYYIYNTGYPGTNRSMDVTVTISSDTQAPPFSITLTPSSQTITQGDSITAITISSVMASGDISYSSASLPTGLTISGDRITGAISAVGTYTFTVNATDAAGSTASATATITVNSTYVPPSGISGISITTPAAKTITLSADGGTFSATLSASGEANGSIIWTASATQGLTADISGSGSTATLSGTAQPNTSSQDISGTITVTAHDDIGTNYFDTLTVIVSGLFISGDIISQDISQDISIDVTITGIAFTPETVTLSADGGLVTVTAAIQGTPSGDVTWSVASGDFSLSAQTGSAVTITGTVAPNTTSYDITHTVRVTAEDSVNTASGDFTVIVAGIGSSSLISGDITSRDIISGDQTESGDHSGGSEDNPDDDPRPYYEKYTGDSWNDAYVMGSQSDFMNLLERFIDGSESAGKYYAINADIDMSALSNFQSIGSETNPFRGHFDGGGKTITIPANVRGLFGLVDTDGIAIQDLNVRTVPSLYNGASGGIPPTDYAGGIVQELVNGTITGCTFTGTVTADGTDSAAGGIVGLLSGGTVQNCRVLSGSGIYASHSAGGIVGYVMAGSVSNCTSDADVDAEFSGGIAGYTEAERRNITANSYTIAVVEVGNDELSIGLLPVSQTVRAGTAITDIQVSSDNAASWSFRVSGDYALGLTSRDMVISGTIPAWTQAGRYTITVNALNSNGFTASAQAYITVVSLLESGDVISGDIISGDVISGDQRPTPSTPGGRDNPVDYVFDIPAGIRDRVTMHFNNETIYQFTADEIISAAWELDAVDLRAIADLYESVVLRLPILRPKNTGLYMLRLDLSGAGAGKKINLYGITSGGGGNLSTTALENMDYMLLDENGNEVTQVPENGIVYAVLRLTANREHRGVITSPIELERGSIQPVKAEELGNTVLEKIAENVNISADQIKFITEENISDPQEPTENMRSELESRQNQIIGKFNTLYVRESGYYVFRVTLSDDLYEQVKGVSINELKVYALFDDGRPSSADVRASFVSGLLSTWELLSLNGEKLEFGVKEFLMVGFLNASTPLSVYLTKLIIMLLLGGCDAGLGIAGLAVTALGAIFFIVRRKH